MSSRKPAPRLSMPDMEAILAVTRALATPFELHPMLEACAAAARRVLRAERASVWLHDEAKAELFIEVASDLPPIRVPMGSGFVGTCARERQPINVPDCYADPRFNAEIDRRSGFHTRCLLALPLIDHRGVLVGVMQVLNKHGGAFDAADQALAEALAAQCAVALARVRMVAEALEAERMRHEVELASVVQRSTLPASLPVLPGYAMHGHFLPAEATGGDTYDLALVEQGLLVMLADATGHGIAPALSVIQMHAMLRIALRLGASLESAFRHVNDRLAEVLPDSRFVTACIGLLDPGTHRLRLLSGGQAPLLHYRAADGGFMVHRATSFPMGAAPIRTLRPAIEIELQPGDWFVLLSDGVYECCDGAGVFFGRERVEALVRAHAASSPAQLCAVLLAAVAAHTQGRPQDDDITIALLKREPQPALGGAAAGVTARS